MSYGYEFLHPPRLSSDDPNRHIETCDLMHIGHFLCPTTYGDPLKCMECKGLKTCTAGQRAMVLLDEETRASVIAPVSPRVAPETASGMEVEEFAMEQVDWLREAKETLKQKQTAGAAAATKKRVERARAKCMAAIASGDPLGYLESTGISRKQAITNWSRYHRVYPDLFEGVETKPKKVEKPKVEPKAKEPDEMSLADFLKEFGAFEEPMETEEPERKQEPTRGSRPEPVRRDEENPNRILSQLMVEEADLLRQIAELQDQVWGIRARRKEIEKKLSH